MQTHEVTVHALPVPVSSYEALLFLMSFMSSDTCIIFASSFIVYPEILEKETHGDMPFRSECSRNVDSLHSV